MTAYNKLNGLHVSENPFIIQHILRGEWGFNGLVMSDWFGTYSTAEAVSAGLDIEMPGPTRWRRSLLAHSVNSGKIPETVVDDRARAVLNLVNRCTESKVPSGAPEGKLDTPATSEKLRKIATESIVLLKNDQNILPLHKGKSTLLVGPHATNAIFSGGGSSALTPYTAISPYTGIKNILPSTTPLSTVLGTYTHKELPLLGPYLTSDDGSAGFDFCVYASPPGRPNRELAEHICLTDSHILLQDFSSPQITSPLWYATMTGSFVPEESGRYDFGLCVYGTAKLYVDDELVVDNTTYQRPGTAFYGTGTVEEINSIHMQAGRKYKVRVEFASAPTNTLRGGGVVRFGGGGLRVGAARQIDADEELGKAITAAKEAEQVVIIAALGPDWEGEGHDRENMKLPGRLDELISAVASANKNTTVVLQTGMPIEMPWADSVNSIVQAWYLGNEAGHAIADVLFGNESPSGKLSVSFPRTLQDNPAYLNYRCEGGRTLYGEDVYVGYRWYDAVQREALFPFGHGLGYSKFALNDLQVMKNGKDEVAVSVLLANMGHVPAKEVLQVYVTPKDQSAVRRPPKELQGFTKEHFEGGEKRTVSVKVQLKYAAGYWDESREMWRCEKGRYGVVVCTSTTGRMLRGAFEVDEEFWWKGL
jgi:beta-glucosidase